MASLSLMPTLTLTEAQAQFEPEPGWLNTASYGLPPRVAWDELQAMLADWRHGRTSWEQWDTSTGRARASFARLVGVPVEQVATGSVVSPFVGLLASSLPSTTHVLVPEGEFTSNLFPYLVQQEARGLHVETVPLESLLDKIQPGVGVVAISVVQSSDGTVTDLGALATRTHDVGALLAVDATQAVGWLPVDARQVDLLVCGGYKWLCSPRGSSFCVVSPALRDTLVPQYAGWYAGEDAHASYYGPTMRLAHDARRFDTSPGWPAWVGTAPALELLEQVGIEQIHGHDVSLANRFRAGLGLEPSDSAIVAAQVADAERKLAAAGVRAASRAGSLRVSFHLYSTEADVDLALDVLVG